MHGNSMLSCCCAACAMGCGCSLLARVLVWHVTCRIVTCRVSRCSDYTETHARHALSAYHTGGAVLHCVAAALTAALKQTTSRGTSSTMLDAPRLLLHECFRWQTCSRTNFVQQHNNISIICMVQGFLLAATLVYIQHSHRMVAILTAGFHNWRCMPQHLPCTQARLVGAVTLLPCKCAAPLPPLLLPDWCVYDVCNRVQARGLTQPTVSSHSFSNSWNPTHVRVIQSRLTCSPAALWCCSLC